MKPLLTIALAAMLATTVTLSSWADHQGGCSRNGHGHHRYGAMTVEQKVQRMQKSLDLSAAQAQQLKEILSNRPDWKQSHDQMAQQHRQLKQVLSSPNSTKEEALRLQSEISAEHQRLEQQHIEKMYEIRSVLTQEQRQKFAQQMEKRMEKRHARMQKWESRAEKTRQQ